MACCAALTIFFAWIYRVIRWFGGATSDEEFAPAATWPPTERPVSAATPSHAHAPWARVLIVVGIAWFIAGVLAMHVFGLLAPIHSELGDVAFHASGLWLATAGLALKFLPRSVLRSAA